MHEQIAAHPLAGIPKRLGGTVKVTITDKPDEAVAQILPLEQHEYDDNDNQSGRSERADQRADYVLQDFERFFARDDLDGHRLTLRFVRGGSRQRSVLLVDLLTDTLDHAAQSGNDPSPDAGFLERTDLGQDVGLVDRDILRQFADLRGDDEAEQAKCRESAEHADDDSGEPGYADPFEGRNQGCEREGQQQRDGDRQENLAPEIQRRHRRDDGCHGGQ